MEGRFIELRRRARSLQHEVSRVRSDRDRERE